MNKKTKMILGVGVVAAAAYYFWNKSKTTPETTKASLVGQDGSRGGYGRLANCGVYRERQRNGIRRIAYGVFDGTGGCNTSEGYFSRNEGAFAVSR